MRGSKFNPIVAGVSSTISSKLSDPNAAEDADRLAQGSMVRIGTDAANRAPVETGHLRNTMTSGIKRSAIAPKGVWDLEQQTEYTLVQEFEHKTKRNFIVNSVKAEEPRYKGVLEERFKGRVKHGS